MNNNKILIINGVNLNLLGKREPNIYGSQTFEQYFEELVMLFPQFQLEYYQSNTEGFLVDKLHEVGFSYQGIILNAGAYTHTSIALADAISAIETPVIEVHISNIYKRESFRHKSFLTASCQGIVSGFGLKSYAMALHYFL
ncbi:MAG: type II 3-dehydroquinate dehydratase [Bacteroidetes bacterium]|nr:MAG: type II 3-dehydroquinate dehydratase [Bacteroidota bacterium]TAG89355.1 MAG: type II 3-dehydroquinate dehydratase [Bacteroidota bacterium]